MATDVMDIEDLGRYLKLAPVTLYKMVKEGKIPCRRIGKSLRFPKTMIDRWLNQQEESKTIPPAIQVLLSQFANQARERLRNRIKEIRLYGSWARNEGRIDSDIDVAVIVDRKDLTAIKIISEIAANVSLESDRFVSALVIEQQSHQKGKEEGYPFHIQIDREGIPL